MEAALGAIQVLLAFAEAREIALEERVLTRQFLETHEIHVLCDRAEGRKQTKKGASRAQKNGVMSDEHKYKRLTFIATYLEWFAHRACASQGRRRSRARPLCSPS